ncbi:MAG TPA: GGDEF domain-containing protein, partial [Candidatus Binatus sp.]|nr:GGDEF domain-containing protein [Candidatus Binatus sp.]
ETPAPRPIDDAVTLRAAHQERLAHQVERQAGLNFDLARRCAAQTAQISVLAQIGEKFLGGNVDRDALHAELVTQYLDATGFSSGAILIAGENGRLTLSAQAGFSASVADELPRFFERGGRFAEIIAQGEPLCFTSASSAQNQTRGLLSFLDAETVFISPLRFGSQDLGLMLVTSRVALGDSDWLVFAKAITHEITQVMALNDSIARLRYLASYDTLTGLANRAHLLTQLQKAAGTGGSGALYLFNLDHFQKINNTLSFQNGNVLLKEVAARLRANVPAGATIARLGADEFAVWRRDTISMEAIHRAAREMLKSLEPTFKLAGLSIALRATVGIATMT